MQEAARQRMLGSVKRCLDSGDYSDLVITCGGDTYNVHKIIVCTRAEFFSRAIKFGGQESTEAKIDLSCDEPMIIKLLMQYLYQEEYEPHLRELTYSTPTIMHGASRLEIILQSAEDDTWSCEFVCTHCTRPAKPEIEGTADELLLHAKMYKIADKYNVIGLKELVQDKFKRACAAFWDQDTFAVAGHHVFTTTMPTDKGLRDIVSDTISKHMELIQKPEVQALLNEHNGLALGILLQKAEENGWVKK